MDWDCDGDEDFTDGVLDGAFWFGPTWLGLLILAIFLGLFCVSRCTPQPEPVPAYRDAGSQTE